MSNLDVESTSGKTTAAGSILESRSEDPLIEKAKEYAGEIPVF